MSIECADTLNALANRVLVAGGVLLLTACASAPRRVATSTTSGTLPAGAGRTILQNSCTVCHDLSEVTKFSGYYNRQQWQDIVSTMVGYGATVNKDDVELLVDYLTQSIGRK
jgi:cytochrome c5